MINNIKNKLSESRYFKSIFQLTLGSLIAQIITVVVSPITTRLYTPEELGVYTLLLTIISMFGPVLSGKYDMVIVTAKDEKEVMELVIGSAFFSFIFIVVLTICYYFYLTKNPEIASDVGGFAYLIIGILFVTALINILSSYNNRYKEYKIISSVYVIRTFVQNISLVIFGMFKFGTVGLLFSQLFGLLFGIKKQAELLYRNRFVDRKVQLKGIKNTLIKYKNQPLFSMPAHFINSTSYSILNFFISGLFGNGVLGYYSMSYRILGLPLSLVSMNISKVFFQRASEERLENGNYYKSLMQMTILLGSLSIPMVVILIILGPDLFEFVFGDGWSSAGIFVQILAPMFGIRFVVSALTPALIVSGEQRLELLMQSLFIICSVLSFVACKYFALDIHGFLTLISITYSIIYILYYIIIYKLSKKTA